MTNIIGELYTARYSSIKGKLSLKIKQAGYQGCEVEEGKKGIMEVEEMGRQVVVVELDLELVVKESMAPEEAKEGWEAEVQVAEMGLEVKVEKAETGLEEKLGLAEKGLVAKILVESE